MADNINQTKDKFSFVSAGGEVPWHKKGIVVPEQFITAEACMRYANLDYTVVKKPLYAFDDAALDRSPFSKVEDHYATIRTDTGQSLGVVGKRYTIVQNRDGFGFFDAIVGEGAAIYTTAGCLGKGEVTFITAKMPEYIRIDGTDDVSEVYVVLKMSHDGSGSIKAMVTPIRVVCRNTLNAALRNAKNIVSIRHTESAKERLEEAHKLLGISHQYVEEVNQLFNRMKKVHISDEAFTSLVETLFTSQSEDSSRLEKIHEAVLETYHTGVGQDKILGTAWGAYNGITHYLDHVKKYKTDDSKFESILEGSSSRLAQKAFDWLSAMN
jgi:phage/plasmid-like protein (TIGR03299 family)